MGLFGLLRMWAIGLLAVGLWVAVVFLAREWAHRLPDPRPPVVATPENPDPPPPPPPTFGERVAAWRPGADAVTAFFAGAAVLTLLSLGGGRGLWWLFLPKRADDPVHERPGEFRRIKRPDGTELHVEVTGNPTGPTVILTHGWGASATEWYYLRRQLGGRYRLVAWDLPGLGLSDPPADRNYALDKLAADLRAVLDDVGGPAVLLGHSIGGMISLTFAKQYPAELGDRVAGLVLVHTTHTNPVTTTLGASVLVPLQKPVLEPLCYLMIGLSPLVWLMNVVSYLNGSMHASNWRSLFSRTGTWGQLEWASRYALGLWPATYARGMLGMFGYHATDALGRIPVPTLVVAADRDQMTKPVASAEIRAGVPGSELATLTPAGHFGLVTSHEEFGRVVGSFLDRTFAAAPAGRAAEPVRVG